MWRVNIKIRHIPPSTSLLTGMITAAMLLTSLGACRSFSGPAAAAHNVTFTFAVTDDSRAAGGAAEKNGVSFVVLNAIATDIADQHVAFVLFPGDMVSGETDSTAALSSMLDTWTAAMAPVYGAGIPVYTTRGNHEYHTPKSGARNRMDPSRATYLAHFSMPPNGPSGEAGLTYSFTWMNAKIIAFDQYAGRKDSFDNTLYAAGSNKGQMMNPWVLDEVNTSSSGVTFVMAHEQIWPSRSHPDCLANDPDSRDALIHALGTHHGAYFAGHDHLYLRGFVTDADGDKVPAFTVGTAGGGNYGYGAFNVAAAGYTGPDAYTVQKSISSGANPVFGYLLVTVYSDNTWSAAFRGFRFNRWNDAADVSLTPISVMDSFKSSDLH